MRTGDKSVLADIDNPGLFERAAEFYLNLRESDFDDRNELEVAIQVWRDEHPSHEEAYQRVEVAWRAVGHHAHAPELVLARRDALGRAGKAAKRRWVQRWNWRHTAAAVAVPILLIIGAQILFLLHPRTDIRQFETAVGETRVVTLEDNTRISLDAQTRLTVQYSTEARSINLSAGQAYFDVAKDVMRPFRVAAGGSTVVALGTAFNVELLDDQVLVTLIEGRVAIDDGSDSATLETVAETGENAAEGLPPRSTTVRELSPGQQLVLKNDGEVVLRQDINLTKATSWKEGRLIFEDEPLFAAVARMNRYSNSNIILRDDVIRNIGVSGVFNAGDTDAFVEAVEAYFPIRVVRRSGSAIWLYARTDQDQG